MAAKKVVDRSSFHCHSECVHSVPDRNFLSFVTGEPIIGGCEFSECGFLLDEKVECVNFREI